jgi:hypothetical protein
MSAANGEMMIFQIHCWSITCLFFFLVSSVFSAGWPVFGLAISLPFPWIPPESFHDWKQGFDSRINYCKAECHGECDCQG